MTPARFHVPPNPFGPTRIAGGPPEPPPFSTLLPENNRRNRLSGDQNGKTASSLPFTTCASRPSSARSQIANPFSDETIALTYLPSGDTVSISGAGADGGATSKLTVAAGSGAFLLSAIAPKTMLSTRSAPAATHGRGGCFLTAVLAIAASPSGTVSASSI